MVKKWWYILISIIIIVGIPIAIDWLIIGNDIPSNISNSDWVAFLGGYVGAIIGAIVSLIGIVITIRYTNDQNKKDRELQVRPYCAIRYVQSPKSLSTRKVLGHFMLGCEPKENNGPRYESVVYIKNIGLGPAIEFSFSVSEIDDGREHFLVLPQRTPETVNNAINLLQSGEEGIVDLLILFNFDEITNEEIVVQEDATLGKYYVKPTVSKKYKNFSFDIEVKYCDIFQNVYAQTLRFASNMYISITGEGKATHECDINLVETTVPIRIADSNNKV